MSSNSQSVKRLNSDLMELVMDQTIQVSGFPSDEDIHVWKGTIDGPADSHYENMQFTLTLRFNTNYPMSPPTVTFDTPIFHPNIDMSGNICLDILKDKWAPALSAKSVLLSIQTLLTEPNNSSPLNGQAAQLWDSDPKEFLRLAKRRYNKLPIN